ncbi:MAG: tRNA pseudouridine(55) synthase TruB [Candidatus Pacebacteria bacterium]|nr:tRNA pseudouridine(55) synthase TruB [Candidatus Paceibacterota bacterium]
MTKFSTIAEVKKDRQGIILIDKNQDWTSHDVVAKLRGLVGVKKIGHAGTLDPLATGLLIILVGREFTKLQDQFMKQDKEYEVEAEFGKTTDSYDAMGEIVSEASWDEVSKISQVDLTKEMLKLTGQIEQTVPAYSAVKVRGKKLYQKARQGNIDLSTLPTRIVNIYNFEIKEFDKDLKNEKLTVKFFTKVSSGTYIRSLIHDLGQVLQVGAYVTQLRRISIGTVKIDGAEKI